jgi:hypothetical protein
VLYREQRPGAVANKRLESALCVAEPGYRNAADDNIEHAAQMVPHRLLHSRFARPGQ